MTAETIIAAPTIPAQPETSQSRKQVKRLRLKLYGFDVTGVIYQREKYTAEQWEALKTKLGSVVEVEASNQSEAYDKYEQVKQGKRRTA